MTLRGRRRCVPVGLAERTVGGGVKGSWSVNPEAVCQAGWELASRRAVRVYLSGTLHQHLLLLIGQNSNTSHVTIAINFLVRHYLIGSNIEAPK
jgi:hypothetical protein